MIRTSHCPIFSVKYLLSSLGKRHRLKRLNNFSIAVIHLYPKEDDIFS